MLQAAKSPGILEGDVGANPEIAVHKIIEDRGRRKKGHFTFLANPKITLHYIYDYKRPP